MSLTTVTRESDLQRLFLETLNMVVVVSKFFNHSVNKNYIEFKSGNVKNYKSLSYESDFPTLKASLGRMMVEP